MSEPAKVFEDRETPGQWRVEWFDDDGACELVEIFHRPPSRGGGRVIVTAPVPTILRAVLLRS